MSLSSLLPPGLSIIQAIELLTQIVADTQAVNLAAGAASAWIAYDICLTFADEIDLVWRAKWSLPKVMYFGVRYYGLFVSLMYFIVNSSSSPTFGICQGWPWFDAFGATVLISSILGEGMFVLRLWATYENSKPVRGIVAFCFLAELTSSITISIIEARTITVMPRPPGFPLPGCFTFAVVPLRNSLPAWIINCSVTTTYFVLMLYKTFSSEVFKMELSNAKSNPLAKWTEFRRFSPLLYLLLRDGSMYFAMFFLVNALNMALSIRLEGRALEAIGVAWTIAVSSVASSRLLLNLRGFIGHDNSVLYTEKTTLKFESRSPGTTGVSYDEAAVEFEDSMEMQAIESDTIATVSRGSAA